MECEFFTLGTNPSVSEKTLVYIVLTEGNNGCKLRNSVVILK